MSQAVVPAPKGLGSQLEAAGGVESAVTRARTAENVVVGDEIVRHRLSSRAIHWGVAGTFVLALLTGMPIWTPIFGWMAHLFGGLEVCRWLHPYSGVAFAALSLIMFLHWMKDMRLAKNERDWLSPRRFLHYLRQQEDPEVGKYNGGQKLLFYFAVAWAILLAISGIVLWWPMSFGRVAREASILVHDATFIVFFIAIVWHIYLGTAAGPGTFRAMTRGTVTRGWARLHHPRWFREMTGGGVGPGASKGADESRGARTTSTSGGSSGAG